MWHSVRANLPQLTSDDQRSHLSGQSHQQQRILQAAPMEFRRDPINIAGSSFTELFFSTHASETICWVKIRQPALLLLASTFLNVALKANLCLKSSQLQVHRIFHLENA